MNGAQTLAVQQQQQQQYATIVLNDEDFSSMSSFNGHRRLNTLRHYGLTDQGIMMLKRKQSTCNRLQQATILGDMLGDDHYSNPYAEIQYGHCNSVQQQQQQHQTSGRLVASSRTLQHQQQQQLLHADRNQNSAATSGNATKWWHLSRASETTDHRISGQLSEHSNDSSSSPSSNSPSMMLLANHHHHHHDHNQRQHPQNVAKFKNGLANEQQQQQQQQFYHPSSSSSSSASSTGNVMDTHSTSANSRSIMNPASSAHVMLARQQRAVQQQQQQQQMATGGDNLQQPIYCQIGSISAQSQHNGANNGGCSSSSTYYCHIGQSAANTATTAATNLTLKQRKSFDCQLSNSSCVGGGVGGRPRDQDDGQNLIYLSRMLTSKGTIQKYIDDFFKTILTVRPEVAVHHHHQHQQAMHLAAYEDSAAFSSGSGGACPPAVKWIFDLLDEAAARNGISDKNVVHAWKSNAFLLRFWVNFIKNPNYILDVDKSSTLDASLSVIAQTLMDSCATTDASQAQQLHLKGDNGRLIFAKDCNRYKELVRRFYQDVASMRPVSDQEMVKQMGSLSMASTSACKFDTNLALKELCVYAVNYGTEMMSSLNGDYACQQMDLAQQLEQCFRSFTIFEAYQ